MRVVTFQCRTIALAILVVLATIVGPQHETRAAPIDELRVSQLQQEILELQSQVRQQSRRIDALENALRQSRVGGGVPPGSSTLIAATTKDSGLKRPWLQNANWDKLYLGMAESEVLRLLGPPTTARKSDKSDTQTLFYALELEAGGFLSGQIIIADQRVLEIHKPALK